VDPGDLTELGLLPDERAIVAAYLTTLDRELPAGRRARAAIVAELGDGLACAVRAHRDAGPPPADAAAAAVAEFGDPHRLAAAFVSGLAGRTAHRTGLALIVTGPLVGSTWVVAFATRSGERWPDQIGAVLSAVPVFAAILAVVVPAAVVAAVGAGTLAGRVSVRTAAGAAILAAFGCVAGDAMLLSTALATPQWTVLAVPAVAASALRLTAAATAGRRCVLLRAAVY
jgi:hypothetical protein